VEEEYSRLTAPERYRIVHARGREWAAGLAELPTVRVAALEPPASDVERRRRSDRGLQITCSREGTLPLFLLEFDGDVAGLKVSFASPELILLEQPDCGCDACDSGSQDLLDAIDETIGFVVGGPVVFLQGKDWSAQWHPGGGQASGLRRPSFREVMATCRQLAAGESVRLPRGVRAFVGRSWL